MSNALRVRTVSEKALGLQNQEVFKLFYQILQHPGEAYNPLLIQGEPQAGKTLLLEEGSKWLKQQAFREKKTVSHLFFRGEHLGKILEDALKNREILAFQAKILEAKVLFIDDLQKLSGVRSLEQFRFLFDLCLNHSIQMIFSCVGSLCHLSHLPLSLKSRLESGILLSLTLPDFQSRLAAYTQYCKRSGTPFTSEVLEWLSHKVQGNFTKQYFILEKLLDHHPYCLLSLEETQTLFDRLAFSLPLSSLSQLESAVARLFEIQVQDLREKTHQPEKAMARTLTMWLATRYLKLCLYDLSAYYHLTVPSVRRVLKKAESALEDPVVRLKIQKLCQELYWEAPF
jgi:chromosomal replication initiator protein